MRARLDHRLAGLLGITVILAACSGGTASATPAASVAAPSAAASAAAPTAAPSAPEKTLEIAYLSFAVANSYDAPMLAAAQAAAAARNAKLTVFDANLQPPTQLKQLQDATASGKYDGIITQPLFGAGLVEDVKKAIAAGIGVGNIDQVLGSDMTTPNSQVDGLLANVAFVPSELGRKIGELVVTACADVGSNPCNVGYIWSVKAAALDIALKKAFDEAIASHPEIKVVSDTGESFYTTALGLKASQDIVAAHPDVSVIVSADQAITGAVARSRTSRTRSGSSATAAARSRSRASPTAVASGRSCRCPPPRDASVPSSSSRPSDPARHPRAWTRWRPSRTVASSPRRTSTSSCRSRSGRAESRIEGRLSR